MYVNMINKRVTIINVSIATRFNDNVSMHHFFADLLSSFGLDTKFRTQILQYNKIPGIYSISTGLYYG